MELPVIQLKLCGATNFQNVSRRSLDHLRYLKDSCNQESTGPSCTLMSYFCGLLKTGATAELIWSLVKCTLWGNSCLGVRLEHSEDFGDTLFLHLSPAGVFMHPPYSGFLSTCTCIETWGLQDLLLNLEQVTLATSRCVSAKPWCVNASLDTN